MSAPFPLPVMYLFALAVYLAPSIWGYICGRYLRLLLGLTFLYFPLLILMLLWLPALSAVPFIFFMIAALPGYGMGLFRRRNAMGSLSLPVVKRTDFKAGLMLVSVGVMLFAGAFFLGVRFGWLVGRVTNPPSFPLSLLVYFLIVALVGLILVFIFAGVALIVCWLIRRIRDTRKDTDS